MTFKELLNKLVETAVIAQDAAEAQAQERLEDLYETDDDGILHPKTIKLNTNGTIIEVPRSSIRQLSSMKMRELKINLDTDIHFNYNSDDEDNISVNLKKKLFQNSSHISIEVIFEAQDPAEGAKLIQDSGNSHLRKQLGDY